MDTIIPKTVTQLEGVALVIWKEVTRLSTQEVMDLQHAADRRTAENPMERIAGGLVEAVCTLELAARNQPKER